MRIGFFSAASLAVIDVVYALRGRISKVYLADAIVEIILASWLMKEIKTKPSRWRTAA